MNNMYIQQNLNDDFVKLISKCGYINGIELKEKIKLLLDSGVNVNTKDKNDHTMLHQVSRRSKYFEDDGIIELLLSHGADVNIKDKYGKTPLHEACKSDNEQNVSLLISYGADIDAIDNAGWIPLHDASYFGNYYAVLIMLTVGANVNALSKYNLTPLYLINSKKKEIKESEQIINLLKRYGAKE